MNAASCLFIMLFLMPSLIFAIGTEGGNITSANLTLNTTASWHGVWGLTSSSTAASLAINATPGGVTNLTLNTSSASCASGVDRLVFLFSNSSENITSLSAGNTSLLDGFINASRQNATATFTATSNFTTASFGNISGVPTTYTQPAAAQDFGMGYLQDQSGNLVFITAPVENKTGFSGAPTNYQIMLPTANSQSTTYYLTVDLLCNVSGHISITLHYPANGASLSDSNPAFAFTANYSSEPNMTCYVTIDGSLDRTLPAQNGTLVQFYATSPFADGAHTWHVRCQDTSENYTTSTYSFSVSTGGGGGGGGGSYTISPGVSIRVLPKPPPLVLPGLPPSARDLRVLRFTPYREAFAGTNLVVSPIIENPTDVQVEISVGLSGSASALATPVRNVVLAPHAGASIPFDVYLPKDMPIGFYSFSVEVSTNNSMVSYPSVIHLLSSSWESRPSVLRQFSLDYAINNTFVTLTLSNPTKYSLAQLNIFESVPSSLVTMLSSASLIAGSASGTGSGSTMRWEMRDVKPYESRAIVYKVPYLVTDFSEYSAWNLAQMAIIEPSDITVRDLRMPSLFPGEQGNASFSLFNIGNMPQEVSVEIIGPQGWKIEPSTIPVNVINPDEIQRVDFSVETLRNSPPGTYGITLRLSYGGTYFDRQTFIYVYQPDSGIYAPPLADQLGALSSSVLPPILPIMMFLAVLLFLTAIAYLFVKHSRRSQFSEGRLDSLRSMERMLQDENGEALGGTPPPKPLVRLKRKSRL